MTNCRILGSSPQAQLLEKLGQQASLTNISVLVCGERGVGREFFARLLHQQSGYTGSFVPLNCAGVSETVLESESRRGLAQAAGGAFFLDNVEEAPLTMQSEMARLAESSGVRLIGATTAANIDNRLASGLFGMRVSIAPLRERRSDIPIIVDHFSGEFARQYGKEIRGVQPATQKKLMSYSWPGNIREVRDAVERAVNGAKRAMLELDDFAFLVTAAEEHPLEFMIPGATIYEIEKVAILRTLAHAGGSTTAAARILKMSVRKIQYKLKQYRNQDDAVLVEKAKARSATWS